MSIQAAWNSALKSAAVGIGSLTQLPQFKEKMKKPESQQESNVNPSDADVYHALAEQRGTMLQQEINKRREREMADMRAREAAQDADAQPLNTLRGATERIRQISEAAPATLSREDREERIRSAIAEAFGVRREQNNG